VLKGQ
jgi:hypothetical protein